jgi:hypothetical protein
MVKRLVFLCAIGVLSGCSRQASPVSLGPSPVPQPRADYSDLSKVLAGALNSKGQLLPAKARELEPLLDRQLKLLSVTGPHASPELFAGADRDDKTLAYWYNARAAWAIKLAIVDGLNDTLGVQAMKRSFVLDGRTMSLAEIDVALERQLGWRAAAAAPCVCLDAAGLPAQAFDAATVRQAVAERFNDFVGDPQRFVIDVPSRTVRVPEAIWRRRAAVEADYRSAGGATGANLVSALLPFTSGGAHRRLQDAIGYRIVPAQRRWLLVMDKQ